MTRVVIVGAGQGGAATAVALRGLGFDGSVTVVGAEQHQPYERPPLSKGYLRGEVGRPELSLQPASWWDSHDVRVLAGTTVRHVDRTGMRVELAEKGSLGYDWLVLAPGSSARPLPVPGADLDGVLTLRSLDDADALRERAAAAEHVLVVGGGWIGTEVTASLRQAGTRVSLAVRSGLPLERVLSEPVAEVYDRLHRERGATVLPRSEVVELAGDGGVRHARMRTGQVVETDLVVAAVGARPQVELAVDSGLAVRDGVVVDERLRTTDPRILAIGDVALTPYPDLGRALRLEHWNGAETQGVAAARTILGLGGRYEELPYFYSDQYETGMEFWGDPLLPGELVVRGSLDSRAFTAFRQDRSGVRAVLGMHVHGHGAHGDHDHQAAGDHDHEHGGHDHDHEHGGHDRDHDGHDQHHEHGAEGTGGADPGHGGGHLEAAAVAALIRARRPVDPAVLSDPDAPLESLIGP